MVWRNALKISHGTEVSLFEETCSKIVFFCNKQSLKHGICVHSSIIKTGLHYNLSIGNNLLSLYCKCYGVEHARHFFDEMPYRDVVSWTGLLSAYVKVGCPGEALELFDWMMISGDCPNAFTLSSAFRACSALRDAIRGTKAQAYAIKNGFDSNHILTSSLIDFYSKCGYTEEAYKAFSNMQNADTISWTTMISSFVQGGNWIKALKLLLYMIKQRVFPNKYTFAKILSACGGLGSIYYGKLVHAQMIVWGVQLNLVLKTSLADMYAKCQRMEDALKVSEQTPEKDVMLWTTLVNGFTQNMKVKEAIDILWQMVDRGIFPNEYTYAGVLNACSTTLALQLGKQVHSQVIKVGLESNVSAGNALIDMYMKCSGSIGDAFWAFEALISPNVISWTSLIAGLAEQGLQDESFQAFEMMRFSGVAPNSFTLSSILRACGTAKSADHTTKLHGYLIKTNMENHIIVANALVDAYAGFQMFDDAWCVVGQMDNRDTITYTSLATRLNQVGFNEMALRIINHMQDDDVEMDGFTLSCFFSASASLGGKQQGMQLHCYAIKSGFSRWVSVSNGLIDFYSKCSYMNHAHRAFEEARDRDVVSWNSLMFGMAFGGHISSALSTFEDMMLAGIKPDSVSLSVVLFACNRGGLADMGLEYFYSIRKAYNIEPELYHYVSLVDLLGKAGRLQEALALVEKMPFKPDATIYKTMLNACKIHGDLILAEDMARRGLELDPCNPVFYLLLKDMYEYASRSDLSEKILRLMKERGIIRKDSGNSFKEKQNNIPTFVAEDCISGTKN